ncbi:MAG: hypothetical protein WAL71_20065 [Terriglobales bacterium]|jgi:hypothetical protein
MKRIVLAMLLVASVTAVAQTASTPAQSAPQPNAAPAAAPQPSAAPAAAPQKKEIKDPAEYNAYMGALGQQDAAAKVSGMEAFLVQYPNSVMKEDALEILMGAYEQTNNSAKTLDTAQKLLLANPCNLRALALITYSKQTMAAGGKGAQNLTEAGQTGEKGLQCLQTATKPPDTSDADWQKLKTQTTGIFNNAAGMSAFAAKDFAKAEQYLRAAVAGDPTNLTEAYYLGRADLSPGASESDVEGLFYIARASDLQADAAGKAQIADYGKKMYKNYHGSETGWSDVLALAATATKPPDNFTIAKYVPPTPAEQCTDLIKSKKVEEMNFAEWQLCLSEGAAGDADKVWTTLKGKPLRMVAHVMSIDSPKQLKLAGSSDDIDAKRADIDLTMSAAIPAKMMPKEDADMDFEGTPISYVAKPFVMTMNDGALVVKAPAKPSPTHKKPAAQ